MAGADEMKLDASNDAIFEEETKTLGALAAGTLTIAMLVVYRKRITDFLF